jgi:outer membrane protein
MQLKPIASLIIALALLSCGAAHAQAPSAATATTDAQRLLQNGQPQAACDRLQPLLPSDDLRLRFLLGQCLARTGHPGDAIPQYQFILARDPTNTRARAELANAELAAGQTGAARVDYQAVLDANPPPQVRADLQRILASLASPQAAKEWSAQVTGGFIYDSNPGAGPSSGTITAFGTPFQISNSFVKHADWGMLASGELDYAHFFNDSVGLTAGVAVGGVHYFKYDQFDYGAVSGFAGPAFRGNFGALPFQLNSNFNVSHAWYDHRDYSNSLGLAPLFTMPISSQLIFLEQASFEYNQYYTNDARSGPAVFGVTSLQWFWGGFGMPGAYIQPKLLLGYEQGRIALDSDDQIGGSIGLFQPLGHGFSLYVEPGIRNASYNARDPAFGNTRNDTIYTTNASIGYDLGWHDAQVSLNYAWTFADSNQALYTYHRHQGTVQLTVPF